MSIDTTARMLAANAQKTASSIVDSFTNGFSYCGAVDYAINLPQNNNKNGDMFTVLYAGSSGNTPLNARYAWGEHNGTNEWILIETGSVGQYRMTFNADNSWTQTGMGYQISCTAAEHLHGTEANPQIWRLGSDGTYKFGIGLPTEGYTVSINEDGDIALSVSSVGRFAGMLVIF